MTNQLYQLVVRKGPKPGQIFPLELDLHTVGRDPLSDIVLEDPEVSRHHASITLGDEGYLLQDKGSTNGSFVDGQRLGGEPMLLKPGQVIMFGSTVTLVYQATPMSDPLATMVAPVAFEEPVAIEELEEPEVAAVVEAQIEEAEPEPEVELAPTPLFDEVEPVEDFQAGAAEFQPEFEEPIAEYVEEISVEAEVSELSEDLVEEVEVALPDSPLFLEEEDDDDDAMATMVEPIPIVPPDQAEEVVQPDPMPAMPVLDEPEPELPAIPVFDEPEPDLPAMPVFDELEGELPAVPAYDEPEPIELPSEPPPLAPLPTFEEPAPEPFAAFEKEDEGAVVDSGAPLPDYEARFSDSTPIQTTGEIVDDKKPNKRNRNIIIGVAGLLLLCCLCLALAAAIYFLVGTG